MVSSNIEARKSKENSKFEARNSKQSEIIPNKENSKQNQKQKEI
jgi:hypothetical protein